MEEGFGSPSANAEGTTTRQPERDLETGDPNLFGAAAPEEKKGIKGRVKDLMGRHGRKKNAENSSGVSGKVKEKLAHKVGHGEDGEWHGPARILSISSSSSMSSSDEEDIGTVGFALDPTGPPVAGRNLGRRDFNSAPARPGADFSKLGLEPNANAATERHAKRAEEFAKWSTAMNPNSGDAHRDEQNPPPPSNSNESGDARGDEHHLSPRSNSNLSGREDASLGGVDHSHPSEAGNLNLNPSEDADGGPHSEPEDAKQTAIDDGEPRSSTPAGMTKSASGAAVGDQNEGPRDENVKPEGFMSKFMDKIRSPKGESAAISSTSTG